MRHIASLISRRTGRRSPLRPLFGAVAVAVVAGALAGCGVYDLPELRDGAVSNWTEVENAYQQRGDLAGELVAVLENSEDADPAAVARLDEARTAATAAIVTPQDLGNAQSVANYAAAQTELASAIEEVLVSASDQAVFRGNEDAAMSIQAIEGTEGAILIATDAYNSAAERYNAARGEFPYKIWSDRLYAADEPLVTLETTAAEINIPTIDFSPPPAPAALDGDVGEDEDDGAANDADAAETTGPETN